MATFTMGLSCFSSSRPITFEDIFGVGGKFEVGGVATEAIITKVIENRYIPSFSGRKRSHQPSVDESMSSIANLVNSDTTIAVNSCPSPIPALCDGVNFNLGEETTNNDWGDVHTPIILHEDYYAN